MNLLITLDNLSEVAWQLLEQGGGRKVWAVHGEMGAGKTTIIHAFCENLGVVSSTGSPTYAIINEYMSEKEGSIYHMDWYRLKSEEEAVQAGVEDCLFSGSRCFVEWSEKAPALLPDDSFHIWLRVVDEQTREVVF